MLSCVSLRILLITIFTSISTLQDSSFVYLGWLLYQVSEGLSVTFWPVCITYWRRLRQWWTHRKWGWKGSCIAQGAQLGALCWPGGVKWARSEGRFKGEGISVYIRLIPFVVQQKPTQHCQAIILQFFFLRVFSHQEADLGKSDGIQIIPSVFQDARVSPGQSLSVSYGIIF